MEIIAYTDPYCTWCWGSEPITGKIKEVYQDQVKIRYVMGGLVKDISDFSDPANGIGGEQWYKQVADHWVEASMRHGMPVDGNMFYDIDDKNWSTYPASIAFKAAQLQGEIAGEKYLRALRVGASVKRKAIHLLSVQLELAGQTGLDVDRFKNDIENGAAQKAFEQDLADCKEHSAHGFPSYLIRNSSGEEMMLRGYTSFKTFEAWLSQLSGSELQKENQVFNLAQVHSFISRNGETAPREIAEVFEVSDDKAISFLNDLVDKDILTNSSVGNGRLYSIKNPDTVCDPMSGSCG